MPDRHIPVLADEVLDYLEPQGKGWIVDGTLGDGGHAELILKRGAPNCRVLGIDRDPEILERTRKRLALYGDRVALVHGNFRDIGSILMNNNIKTIDGFLLDLGVSSYQLDTARRGFSFMKDGPLDMRMNSNDSATAADLLIRLTDAELVRVLREYGDEKFAKRIVRGIRRAQEKGPIQTTLQLTHVIASSMKFTRPTRIHHATRTFQALRIAVNDELESLKQSLEGFLDALNMAGKALVISFHSLEDRIVKNFFRGREKGCVCPSDFPMCVCGKTPDLKVLTRRPVRPGAQEVTENPRSSSARLRIAEKVYV